MNIGSWYIQRFSDETLYFLPVAEQKSRGYSGVLVRVDETRSRARPRATKSSAPSGPYGSAAHWSVLWKPVSEAPPSVERALADRFPEIALAKGVITSRDRGRRARRQRDLSEQALHRLSASSLEQLYNQGRVSKKDVTRWVRMSAKGSGRIYQPTYRSGASFDRLWLRRREDLEERLYQRRKARKARRDEVEPGQGDYVVQGLYSRGIIERERWFEDEGEAVRAAKQLMGSRTFEGTRARVITRDGELVWSSSPAREEGFY